MIVLGVLSLMWGVLDATFGSLPSGTFGLAAKAAAVVSDGWFGHLGWFNAYLPLSDVVDGVGVILALFSVMLTIRVAIWVLTKLHVLGGSDE